MMKKIIAAIFAATILFATVSPVLSNQTATVAAKEHKPNQERFNNYQADKNSNEFAKRGDHQKNHAAAHKNHENGLLKTITLGGVAGLLFGGILINMGILGNVIGLLVNVVALLVTILLIFKALALIKRKQIEKEENSIWDN